MGAGELVDQWAQPAFWAVVLAVLSVFFLSLAAILFARERSARRELSTVDSRIDSRLLESLTTTHEPVVVVDPEGVMVAASDEATTLMRISCDELIAGGLEAVPVRFIDESNLALEAARVFAPRESSGSMILAVVAGDEEPQWLRAHYSVYPSETGSFTAIRFLDASRLRAATVALRQSDERFRMAMESSPVGMALVDLNWVVLEVNQSFADMVGTTVANLRDTSVSGIVHPSQFAVLRNSIGRLVDGDVTRVTHEIEFMVGGRSVWAVTDIAVARAANGQPDHLVIQARDITEIRKRSEDLARRAEHDSLTGLANRASFERELSAALAAGGASGRVAVLVMDLDGFKRLNDRFGHSAGDDALRYFSSVLKAVATAPAIPARLGGDEFVVLVKADNAEKVATELAGAIHAALRAPFVVGRHRVPIAASIGIAALAGEAPRDAEWLLSAADAAMYRAKAAGTGRTEVHASDLDDRAAAHAALARDLLAALDAGDLMLHAQPVVDLDSRGVVGYEVSLRWDHPRLGIVDPAEVFADYADEVAPPDLTIHLIEKAAEFLARGPAPTAWAMVSLDEASIAEPTLGESIVDICGRYRMATRRLVLSVDQELVSRGDRDLEAAVRALTSYGMPVIADSVAGAGLAEKVVAAVHFDGIRSSASLAAALPAAREATAACAALAVWSAALGVASIAAGVANESQARALAKAGWQYAMGWHFGPAVPAESVHWTPSSAPTRLLGTPPVSPDHGAFI